MKSLIILPAVFLLSISAEKCKNKEDNSGKVYKGRLEIKALCMNYTIKVLEGDIDTSWVATSWSDEHSGKSHTNVFALASKCTFPSTIKEGDEFYFTIDNSATQNCPVCMAYYPVPPKKASIKVVEKP
jgi:hypothetical protein